MRIAPVGSALLCLAASLLAMTADAAVGLENTATPVNYNGTDPAISLTVTSATLVIVQVMAKDGTAVTNVSDPTDGNYTLAHAAGSTSDTPRVETWYLNNPTAESKTITVTISSNGFIGAFGLTGTDTSSVICATSGTTGSGTNPNNAITTLYNNSWIVSIVGTDWADPHTEDVSQTSLWELTEGGGNKKSAEGTYELKATAGADTQSWTIARASTNWAVGSVEVKEAGAIRLVKRAFLADGTPLADSDTLPRGTLVKYLLYINNRGSVLNDASVQDILAAAFLYQTGTLKVDNTVAECAAADCTAGEEATIFSAIDDNAASTDAVDGDVVSITGSTIDAGNQNAANAQLDIAANKVWALLFTVKMQ